MARILVVDDEERLLLLTGEALRNEGYEVFTEPDGPSALHSAAEQEPDVILLDLRLPGMGGMEVLKRIKEILPDTEVILMTAYSSVESAVEAMKSGAVDYITKPFNMDDLLMTVRRSVERAELRQENLQLRSELYSIREVEGVVGKAPSIRHAVKEMMRVASLEVPVLLRGESGTGKTLFARLIHRNSPHRDHPLIEVNCAALPETLLENEVFGHEKEAYTGATSRRKGKLEAAGEGTILLDEIADMSPGLQAKVLKVIEERSFFRLGGESEVRVSCRFVFATNADLEKLLSEETFRQDLYYRINIFSINLPPLREHPEDIPLLCEHILGQTGRTDLGVSTEVMQTLKQYPWPGNVRELENVLQSAAIRCNESEIHPRHLPKHVDWHGTLTRQPNETLDQAEARLVRQALKKARGNKSRASELLNISRKRLYTLLRKYDIEYDDAR